MRTTEQERDQMLAMFDHPGWPLVRADLEQRLEDAVRQMGTKWFWSVWYWQGFAAGLTWMLETLDGLKQQSDERTVAMNASQGRTNGLNDRFKARLEQGG